MKRNKKLLAALWFCALALCLALGHALADARPKAGREPLPPLAEISKARFQTQGGVLVNENAPKTGEATLMFTGDLMALSAQQSAARAGDTYNFNNSFVHVKNLFAQADFVMGNLETILSHTFYYTSERKNYGGWPLCNAPATYLDALRYAGFDAVATANNHCTDAGELGVYETYRNVPRKGQEHTASKARRDAQRL